MTEEAEEVVVEVGWVESVEEKPLLSPLPVEVTVAAAVDFIWSSPPPTPPPQAAVAATAATAGKSPSLNGLFLIWEVLTCSIVSFRMRCHSLV